VESWDGRSGVMRSPNVACLEEVFGKGEICRGWASATYCGGLSSMPILYSVQFGTRRHCSHSRLENLCVKSLL